MKTIRVWDFPLRLFHWSLLLLVAISITTGLMGGIEEMELHMRSGYGILGLLLFRILWGFAGSFHARFGNFLRGPLPALRYLQTLPTDRHQPAVGHNAAAGWMVLLMLVVLLVQAVTGLFATDDIFVEGPLTHLASSDLVSTLTRIHHLNYPVIVTLIALHVLAVVYYQLFKRINLTLPMITGRKQVAESVPENDASTHGVRAALLALLSVLVVYAVVNWI